MLADFVRARERKKALSALHIRCHFTRFLQQTVKARGKRIDRSDRLAHLAAFERTLHLREHHQQWVWRRRDSRFALNLRRSIRLRPSARRQILRSQSRFCHRSDHANSSEAEPNSEQAK